MELGLVSGLSTLPFFLVWYIAQLQQAVKAVFTLGFSPEVFKWMDKGVAIEMCRSRLET